MALAVLTPWDECNFSPARQAPTARAALAFRRHPSRKVIMSATVTTIRQPRTLLAARIIAGVIGTVQLVGAVFFLFIAPHEAIWVGPWVDAPVVTLTLTATALKLALALAPGLGVPRRITVGLVAVGLGAALTLIKVPVYEEPEGVVFLIVDAALLVLLLLARRSTRRAGA